MYITRGITKKCKDVYTATVSVARGGQEGGRESTAPVAEAGGVRAAKVYISTYRGLQHSHHRVTRASKGGENTA